MVAEPNLMEVRAQEEIEILKMEVRELTKRLSAEWVLVATLVIT